MATSTKYSKFDAFLNKYSKEVKAGEGFIVSVRGWHTDKPASRSLVLEYHAFESYADLSKESPLMEALEVCGLKYSKDFLALCETEECPINKCDLQSVVGDEQKLQGLATGVQDVEQVG